jgi:putative membrane protein
VEFLDKRLALGIATVFFVILTFFVVSLPASYHYATVSSLFIVLLSLPAFGAAFSADKQKGFFAILVVGIFALLIETIGVLTGFPYTPFTYAESLGGKLGVVPWTVFFAWPPLVFGVWALTKKLWTRRAVFLAPLFLVGIDLVLDPVNTGLGFWLWEQTSWYYGVPLLNFAGWLFSGIIGIFLLSRFFPKGLPIGASYSVVLTLLFVTCASFWMQLWIPFVLGVIFLALLYYKVLPRNLVTGFAS